MEKHMKANTRSALEIITQEFSRLGYVCEYCAMGDELYLRYKGTSNIEYTVFFNNDQPHKYTLRELESGETAYSDRLWEASKGRATKLVNFMERLAKVLSKAGYVTPEPDNEIIEVPFSEPKPEPKPKRPAPNRKVTPKLLNVLEEDRQQLRDLSAKEGRTLMGMFKIVLDFYEKHHE